MTKRMLLCDCCSWVFWPAEAKPPHCPKCGLKTATFLDAKQTYGSKAYKYVKTQIPWIGRKMESYRKILEAEVRDLGSFHYIQKMKGTYNG